MVLTYKDGNIMEPNCIKLEAEKLNITIISYTK